MKEFLDKLLQWCTLPVLGLVITVNYLLGAFWLLFDRTEQLKTMPLNEIGDFLAGIFGALAFFWLVIGYFMQNQELKNQISEFKSNVELQKKIYRDKYRAIQPNLKILNTSRVDRGSGFDPFGQKIESGDFFFDIDIINTGEEVYSLSLVRGGVIKKDYSEKIDVVKKDTTLILKTKINENTNKSPHKIILKNPKNKEKTQKFEIDGGEFYLLYKDKEKRILKQKIVLQLVVKNSSSGDITYSLKAMLFEKITSDDY